MSSTLPQPTAPEDPELAEPSSLDRFLSQRGLVLGGVSNRARQVRVLGILSPVYGSLAVGLTAAGLFASGPAALPLLLNGLGWIVATAAVGGAGLWMRRRVRAEQSTEVQLTPEARKLMQVLIAHLHGWPFGPKMRRRHFRGVFEAGAAQTHLRGSSDDVLSPATFALLDAAAREHNRISGALAGRRTPPEATVARLEARIYGAADAAMADIIHAAALRERYPEAAEPRDVLIAERTGDLSELAEQVERLLPGLAEGAPLNASPVRGVLEELRAEERARTELSAGTESTADGTTLAVGSARRPD